MKKISLGVIHAIAECEDCGWRSENYKNAQATAAIHAKSHRHRTTVEIALDFIYDGREGI